MAMSGLRHHSPRAQSGCSRHRWENERFLPSLPVSPLPGPQVLTRGLNSIPMEQTASSCSFISWKQNPIFQAPQHPCHQLNTTGDSTLKTAVGLPSAKETPHTGPHHCLWTPGF